jgi:hypothetical protein
MRSGFRYATGSVLLATFVFSRGPRELEDRAKIYNKFSSILNNVTYCIKKCSKHDDGGVLKE